MKYRWPHTLSRHFRRPVEQTLLVHQVVLTLDAHASRYLPPRLTGKGPGASTFHMHFIYWEKNRKAAVRTRPRSGKGGNSLQCLPEEAMRKPLRCFQ